MNFIQENTNKVNFYTSLRDVSKWLEISLEDFDFHLTDVDGGWDYNQDPKWITGLALNSIIKEFDYQFVWAVISFYPKGTTPKLSEEPYADGNPDFWIGNPKKQLEDSLFEIVCWDSSATLFIGLPNDLSEKLLKNAPGIEDLNKFNQRTAKRTVN